LTYRRGTLADGANHRDQRRELSLLLCTALLRAAGQEWYEQGDVWARVSDNRPPAPAGPPTPSLRLTAAVARFLTVDTSPTGVLIAGGSLAFAAEWFDAAGAVLETLARRGQLTRGLRAVLAHHVLFHWNRMGLPYQQQETIARTARDVILGRVGLPSILSVSANGRLPTRNH
jgi:thiopeptide-type bacteriocin biosynthesis protein